MVRFVRVGPGDEELRNRGVLGIEERTVRCHLEHISEKPGVYGRGKLYDLIAQKTFGGITQFNRLVALRYDHYYGYAH